MSKRSQMIKEIMQIVVFFVVLGILLTVFVIYPLNITDDMMGRIDTGEFDLESLPANELTFFDSTTVAVDTFRIETDALTSLACVYLAPLPDSTEDETALPTATAIIVHHEQADRNSSLLLAQELLAQEYAVCLYDQRASGLSTGEFHSDGEFEAEDLAELIHYLGFRDKIIPPLTLVGFSMGADAAILNASDTARVDLVIAVDPYITSERWLDKLIDEHDMYWIPFRHTLLKFWLEINSGYAPQYREIANIPGPTCPITIIGSSSDLDDPVLAELTTHLSAERVKLVPLEEPVEDVNPIILEELLPRDDPAIE